MENPKIEYIKISKLKNLEKNPRKISKERLAKLKESIDKNKKYFWARPCLVNNASGEFVVYAGNQRLKAAKALKWDEVPCIVENLTDEDEKERTVRDNVELGEWDWEKLKDWDQEKLDEWGVDVSAFEELADDEMLKEPDGTTEGKKVLTEKGDLYELGDHRLLCGDSTSVSDFEKLMNKEVADLCWTDPPYNIDYKGSAGKIKNDNMSDSNFLNFLSECFRNIFISMKSGGALYVAHADKEGFNFRKAFIESGFKLSGCLIWKKPSLILGRSDYQWQHEPILYGWKDGGKHFWKGGRKQTTIIEDEPEMKKNEDGSLSFCIGTRWFRIKGEFEVLDVESSVIEFDKPQKSGDHPTMKPLGLIAKMLLNSSKKGDIVLDPFLGSGSTMIASEKTGRRCFGLELDEKFVDVIVRRWIRETGAKEFKLNGEVITTEKWDS